MIRILLCGALGHMGRQVTALAQENGFEIAAGIDFSVDDRNPFPLYAGFSSFIKEEADVIIDFSRPAALPGLLEFALARKLPCVLCSTGYGEKEDQLIREAGEQLPLFVSANMSQGVYVLKKLAAIAKGMLPQAEIELIEAHHRRKEDAPSGTAKALLSVLADDNTPLRCGREGMDTRRRAGEIGVHSIRGGTVCGDHEIQFFLDDEIITLGHHAQSRAIFATGALRAARFITAQKPGVYGMDDLMKI